MSRLAENGGQGSAPLPKGWRMTRVKRICCMHSGDHIAGDEICEEGEFPVYGGNDLRGYYPKYNCEGPMLIVGRQGALCGNVHRIDGKFWATEHALITTITHFDNLDYLYYLLTDLNFNQYVSQSAAQPGLAASKILQVETVLPPRPEQERIAAFLDEKCAAVDKAIEVKRKQLESIAAMWKDLLSRATTQGIEGRDARPVRPPNLANDGGHAGCVTLPSGWRCVRLKDCFSYGKGLNITKVDLVDDGTPVVSYGQIHSRLNLGTHLGDELLRYVPDELAKSNPSARLKIGDIVFADTSEDLDGVGNCVVNDVGDGVYAGYHTLIARAKDPRNSKYLSYLFQADCWREQLRKRACGIKVFSLTQRLLSNVKVALPPRDEQELIVKHLDTRRCEFDSLAANLRKQIETLEQYRKSLIHECVTGIRRVMP